jgi:hypothetical protein
MLKAVARRVAGVLGHPAAGLYRVELGEPAVQAVLQAAAASPDPGTFLMNALSAAGIDINTLLGGEAAAAPAPAPMAARDLREGPASGAQGVLATAAAVGAALAALLVMV